MSFFSEFYRVDKLFKALTAPFFSPSSGVVEQESIAVSVNDSCNSQSSTLNVGKSSEFVKFTTENMTGIFGDGDQKQQLGADDCANDCDTVEEAEVWQNDNLDKECTIDILSKNGTMNTKIISENQNDIYKCASDVLNGILLKIADSNGLTQSPLLNHQQQIEHEPETSTDFVDALTGSGDEDFLFNGNSNENKFSFDVKSTNGANNQVQQRNLLDLTLNNSQLELPAFGDKFVNENEEVQQTSTPISDDNFDNIVQDSFVLNSNEFYSKSGEISFDSFETALSTMSDDRPISSKGQYSLDFEKLMASGDAPLETADPFGDRSSAKNKTFTRKSAKPKDNTMSNSSGVGDDPNANDVDKTPKPSNDEINETKLQSIAETKTVVEKSDDVKNSNVNETKTATAVVQNGVKTKDKVSLDETPKKPKAEVSKRDPNVKASGRSAGGQQTAIVAPMINTNVEQQLQQPHHSSDGPTNAKIVKPVTHPVSNANHPMATALAPPPTVSKQESHSDEEFVMASSDLFADPSALDYLQKAGANSVVDSELYRQSLYVKFDPLVTERPTAAAALPSTVTTTAANKSAVVAPVKKPKQPSVQPAQDLASNVQSSSVKTVAQSNPSPVPNASDEILSAEETVSADDDLLILKNPSPKMNADGPSTPTCPPTVVLKKKPAPQARPVGDVDNMLTISPKHNQATTDSGQAETSVQQLKMQFQAYVLAKEKEWVTKFREEREKNERLSRENAALAERASSYEKNATEMKLVVLEYDKTIRDLTRQLEKHKSNKHDDYDQIVKEKEQSLEDLQSVENAFSELHRRYEKLRSCTEDFKKNEEKLRECVVDLQNKLKISEEKFRKLKEHAEDKLEAANAEIEKLQKAKETDTLALRALVKKRDLQVETLEKSLEQKQKEIQELSAICDELIQKVDYPQNTK